MGHQPHQTGSVVIFHTGIGPWSSVQVVWICIPARNRLFIIRTGNVDCIPVKNKLSLICTCSVDCIPVENILFTIPKGSVNHKCHIWYSAFVCNVCDYTPHGNAYGTSVECTLICIFVSIGTCVWHNWSYSYDTSFSASIMYLHLCCSRIRFTSQALM